MADKALAQRFLEMVHAERKRQGIPRPQKMAGRKTNTCSWRWAEVIDLQTNDLHFQPPYRWDSSLVSRGKRVGKAAEKVFVKRLNAIRKTGHPLIKTPNLWAKLKLPKDV